MGQVEVIWKNSSCPPASPNAPPPSLFVATVTNLLFHLSSCLPASSTQVATLSPHFSLFIPFTASFTSNTNALLLLYPHQVMGIPGQAQKMLPPTHMMELPLHIPGLNIKSRLTTREEVATISERKVRAFTTEQRNEIPKPRTKEKQGILKPERGKLQCRAVSVITAKKALDVNQTDFAFFDTSTNPG